MAETKTLSRRGFIRNTFAGGAGIVLAGTPAWEAAAEFINTPQHQRIDGIGLDDPELVEMSLNENPLGPSPASKTAMSEAIDLGHRYPDWYADALKLDLAAYHGITTSQIIVGCGATEILRLAALAFAEPGSNVVCPYPSYGQFASDANFLGAIERYSSLDENHRVDVDDLASQIDSNTSACRLPKRLLRKTSSSMMASPNG